VRRGGRAARVRGTGDRALEWRVRCRGRSRSSDLIRRWRRPSHFAACARGRHPQRVLAGAERSWPLPGQAAAPAPPAAASCPTRSAQRIATGYDHLVFLLGLLLLARARGRRSSPATVAHSITLGPPRSAGCGPEYRAVER
jgi:hypothetical protein